MQEGARDRGAVPQGHSAAVLRVRSVYEGPFRCLRSAQPTALVSTC